MNSIKNGSSLKNGNTKYPIIFAFNILSNYYLNFGTSHFMPVKINLQRLSNNSELFPIVNSNHISTIESRAKTINNTLPKVFLSYDN